MAKPPRISISQKNDIAEAPYSPKPFLSFSIESILRARPRDSRLTSDDTDTRGFEVARSSSNSSTGIHCETDATNTFVALPWLAYTRYSPPKLPRAKKRKCTKRKCSGNPRVPFSTSQLMTLERKYLETRYLSGPEVFELSVSLSLSEHRVKIWFQNRRAREKKSHDCWNGGIDRAPFTPRVVLDGGRCFLPGWFTSTV